MPRRPSAAGSVPKGDAVRHPVEEDHPRLQVALTDWWGGLGGETGAMQRRLLVPRLFLQHFSDTSFVVESDDGALQAFLVGFLSQSEPETAYIHFVGVCPQRRRTGLGSRLYRDFFELARGHGRSRVRCITSPVNLDSVAYHTRMGFSMEPGDRTGGGSGGEVDGDGDWRVPSKADYDGPGLDRVCFVRELPA